jgi:hypothetical protein
LPPEQQLGANRIADLLKGPGDPLANYRVSLFTRKLADTREEGADLHTLLTNGKLSALGFSRVAREPTASPIAALAIEPNAAILYGFARLSGTAAALPGFIERISIERAAAGATHVWVLDLGAPAGCIDVLRNAGFQIAYRSTTVRFLRWQHTWITGHSVR